MCGDLKELILSSLSLSLPPPSLTPSLQLLRRWESAGCMKVVVKAPDEEAL